jgi:hypothetical protein
MTCDLDRPLPLGEECFCRNEWGSRRLGEVVP